MSGTLSASRNVGMYVFFDYRLRAHGVWVDSQTIAGDHGAMAIDDPLQAAKDLIASDERQRSPVTELAQDLVAVAKCIPGARAFAAPCDQAKCICCGGRLLLTSQRGMMELCLLLRNRLVLAGPLASHWSGLLILLALAATTTGQDHNPFVNDPKAAEAGKSHFRINCSICHGLGARGGGRGPDLTLARKKHGNTDAALFQTIHDGVPGTDMPAAMGSVGVEIEYIKSLAKQPAQSAPTLGAIPPGLARRGTTLPPAAPAQNPKR